MTTRVPLCREFAGRTKGGRHAVLVYTRGSPSSLDGSGEAGSTSVTVYGLFLSLLIKGPGLRIRSSPRRKRQNERRDSIRTQSHPPCLVPSDDVPISDERKMSEMSNTGRRVYVIDLSRNVEALNSDKKNSDLSKPLTSSHY